jgi:hypothetical protein
MGDRATVRPMHQPPTEPTVVDPHADVIAAVRQRVLDGTSLRKIAHELGIYRTTVPSILAGTASDAMYALVRARLGLPSTQLGVSNTGRG